MLTKINIGGAYDMDKQFTLEDIKLKACEMNIQRIYIFSHAKHDGDAKGAALALVEYFTQNGYNSKYIITAEDNCLLGVFPKVETSCIKDEKFIAISVDTSIVSGNENDLYKKAEIIYKIDHHKDGDLFGDYNYIDDEASSTCEIVSSMILKDDITPKMATYLYTGIYTDTGGFKYGIRDVMFLQLSKLLKCKADYSFVVNNMKYISSSRKRIEGLVAYNHKFYAKDVVGTIIRKYQHDFMALSVARAVNTLISINAKVFFCCCEAKNGDVFVEIRSSLSSNIDVSKLAKKYGDGGGHVHSAGFKLKEFDEIYNILQEIEDLTRLQ